MDKADREMLIKLAEDALTLSKEVRDLPELELTLDLADFEERIIRPAKYELYLRDYFHVEGETEH